MHHLVDEAAQDVRCAWRLLWMFPGLTVVATLSIGTTQMMFSAVRAMLLKPLNYRDPDQLVRMTVDFQGSFPIEPLNITLSGGIEPEALMGARVCWEETGHGWLP